MAEEEGDSQNRTNLGLNSCSLAALPSLGALWRLSGSSLGALGKLPGSSLEALWGLSGSSLRAL
eukprot:7416885-Alexandrium_andersonii.AAC.1